MEQGEIGGFPILSGAELASNRKGAATPARRKRKIFTRDEKPRWVATVSRFETLGEEESSSSRSEKGGGQAAMCCSGIGRGEPPGVGRCRRFYPLGRLN